MAGTTPSLKATDLLAVKSRVSWGAIGAGAMVALAVYFFLTLLGLAIGLELASRRPVDQGLGIGAAVYSVFTLLFAMFLGGWATSRLAVGETKLEAVLYGVILWGVLFLGMFWLIGAGVRVGFGALVSGAVVINTDDPAAAASPDALNTLVDRYNSEVGGEKFVSDLTKTGVDEAQARKIQANLKEKFDKVRNPGEPDQRPRGPPGRRRLLQAGRVVLAGRRGDLDGRRDPRLPDRLGRHPRAGACPGSPSPAG